MFYMVDGVLNCHETNNTMHNKNITIFSFIKHIMQV